MKGKKIALLLVVLTLVMASTAFANTNAGTEFQNIYQRIIGWATGLPAIIFGITMGLLGAIRGFQSGQYIWIFGGIAVAALTFVLPGIITGLGGATF